VSPIAIPPTTRPRIGRGRPAWLLALALASASAAALGEFARQLDPALAQADARLVALNIAPLLLLWALLWALTRRPLSAAVTVAGLAAAFSAINTVKLQQLGLPVMPSDLGVLGQLVDSPELYWRYLRVDWGIAAIAVVALGLLWCHEPGTLPRGRVRHGCAVLVVVALGSLVAGVGPVARLYAMEGEVARPWLPREAAASIGNMAYFVGLSLKSGNGAVAPDAGALAEFDERFPQLDSPAGIDDTRPDLIIVQSESLFDPARLRGIGAHDFLPEFRRLLPRALHGELVVPTFGGLTTRTEFEMLTGVPLRAIDGDHYPYLSLVTRPLPSLPWLLRQHGYATRAVHPYDRRFYSRHVVYPLLGFDSFHSQSEFTTADHHGYYVSDEALQRRIRELLAHGSPQMIFAVSMENHGPWDSDRPVPAESLADIDVPASLRADDAQALRLFLHHTRRADAALGALADWVLAREQPTLLLFYGDHMPGLNGVFDALGFVDGQSGPRQTLPWLLLDNRRRDGQAMPTLDSSQLAALLLDRAGLNDDRFFRAHSLLRETTDVDPDNARRWLTALARERLQQTVEAGPGGRKEGTVAAILEWSPQRIEFDPSTEAPILQLRLRSAAPLPRSAFLELGGRPLPSRRSDPQTLLATLDGEARAALFHEPGALPLRLVAPVLGIEQPVGELELHAPLPRARLADGRIARMLCPVSAWGPQRTSASLPENPQADGRTGIWVSTACSPHRAQLLFGEHPAPALRGERSVTALLPAEVGRLPGTYPVRLFDPDTEQSIDVGELLVVE